MGKGEVKDRLLWRRVNRRADYGNVHMLTLWICGMYVTQDVDLAALRAIASRTGGVYHINTGKGELIEQGEYLYVEG